MNIESLKCCNQNIHKVHRLYFSDGIEFFLTPEYSVATKGDEDGFIRTQYFIKVIEAKSGK